MRTILSEGSVSDCYLVFVVTNEITWRVVSAMGGQPVCWCGKVDGTYQLTLSDEERPIGSQVVLHPKGDWMHLFEYETFKKILVSYGEVLPYPIYLHYQGGRGVGKYAFACMA